MIYILGYFLFSSHMNFMILVLLIKGINNIYFFYSLWNADGFHLDRSNQLCDLNKLNLLHLIKFV